MKYNDLDVETNEIRLVTILKNESECIECILEHASLSDTLVYKALSYCGDENDTRTIRLDGIEFQATANLEAAFRQLRTENHGKI
jgi:hypothetical protein